MRSGWRWRKRKSYQTFNYQNHMCCRLPTISTQGFMIRALTNRGFWLSTVMYRNVMYLTTPCAPLTYDSIPNPRPTDSHKQRSLTTSFPFFSKAAAAKHPRLKSQRQTQRLCTNSTKAAPYYRSLYTQYSTKKTTFIMGAIVQSPLKQPRAYARGPMPSHWIRRSVSGPRSRYRAASVASEEPGAVWSLGLQRIQSCETIRLLYYVLLYFAFYSAIFDHSMIGCRAVGFEIQVLGLGAGLSGCLEEVERT